MKTIKLELHQWEVIAIRNGLIEENIRLKQAGVKSDYASGVADLVVLFKTMARSM